MRTFYDKQQEGLFILCTKKKQSVRQSDARTAKKEKQCNKAHGPRIYKAPTYFLKCFDYELVDCVIFKVQFDCMHNAKSDIFVRITGISKQLLFLISANLLSRKEQSERRHLQNIAVLARNIKQYDKFIFKNCTFQGVRKLWGKKMGNSQRYFASLEPGLCLCQSEKKNQSVQKSPEMQNNASIINSFLVRALKLLLWAH